MGRIAWAEVTSNDGFRWIFPENDDELIADELLKFCTYYWVADIKVYLKGEDK